jgi:hypothetical protein
VKWLGKEGGAPPHVLLPRWQLASYSTSAPDSPGSKGGREGKGVAGGSEEVEVEVEQDAGLAPPARISPFNVPNALTASRILGTPLVIHWINIGEYKRKRVGAIPLHAVPQAN